MTTDLRQSTFTGGETSPALNGRTDLAKYFSSLARSRNGFITRHGAWMNRSGTRFVCEVKDSTKRVRLVPFKFASGQNYMLEFGHQYIRWIKEGGQLLATGAPAWSNATTYAKDAHVTSAGLTYRSLQDANLNHDPAAGAPWWTQGTIYEITSPYAEADLPRLKFAQIGDIITITHSSYAPRELRRYGNIDWRLETINFTSPAHGIAGGGVPPWTSSLQYVHVDKAYISYDIDKVITGVRKDYRYALTLRLRNDTTRKICESLPFYFGKTNKEPLSAAIGAAVVDVTVALWSVATAYAVTDMVRGSDNALYYCVNANTGFDPIVEANSSKWRGVTPGLTLGAFLAQSPLGAFFSLAEHKPLIAWPSAPAPSGYTLIGYVLYRGNENVFGMIADVDPTVSQFVDDGTHEVDYTISPPSEENPFTTDWPAVTTFFEQRRIMANTPLRPADLLGSKVGDYYNFGWKPLIVEDDAITGLTLAAQSFEEIRWAVPLRSLLLGTNEGVWALSGAGGSNDALTAMSAKARKQVQRPSAWLDPIAIDTAVLTLQEYGNFVREVIFDYSTDSYQNMDLSVMAEHLFSQKTITAWAYAQSPYGIVWAVRSDGLLLGLTYSREHEVAAWHWHDTQGTFEDVGVVAETPVIGNLPMPEHAVYVVARRTIGGVQKRYIERFVSRDLTRLSDGVVDVARGVFLDSSLSYEGVAATVFTGLDHLEGKSVTALAGGEVLGPYVVTGGQIDISADMPDGATYATVGLSYTSQLETLDAALQGKDLKTRLKRVLKIFFEVVDSRGLKLGAAYNALKEWRQRTVAAGYDPLAPSSGMDSTSVPSSFGRGGRAILQQDDPLPVTVLSITREVELGDD